jgi:molybdate transport system substrate-binding protein
VRWSLLVLAALVLMGALDAAFGQQKVLHVAAASDLAPTLPTLAAEYEKATGVKILTSFGSAAMLEQQLENGAPIDVFLSADFSHPEQLVVAHKTVETTPVQYATGVLVLWARKDSPAQPLNLDSLTKASVLKVAIADNLYAPYGVAATRTLAALHLTDAVNPKLVAAKDIAQTAQLVESGNAQVGFISLALASSDHFKDVGTFLLLPKVYPPIRQCAVVMKGAKGEAAGVEFLKWLTSDAVQGQLAAMGLERAGR